jgi:serine/threonine-protein kinase
MSTWKVPGYAEERELGRGGSGRVVSAVDEATGRRVAIKYLRESLIRDPEFLARFRDEAELLRSVDAPQVVRVLDYEEAPGEGAAIVMELVDGVSLYEMISRRGATSPEAALAMLKGSLGGLAAAHRLGIVHRDFKSENVLVDRAGDSKLSDFGVAVKEGRRAPAAGTRLYMAPEQWEGAPAGPSSDIYAATAVFFECLTGKTPFAGRDLRLQHETAAVPVEQVDEPLRTFITRGMAKDPADRPSDAAALMAELEDLAASAYGADWEERGRGELAERASVLLLLLRVGAVGGGTGFALAAFIAGHSRAVIAGSAVAVAVVVAATTTVLAVQGSGTHVREPSPSPGRSRASFALASSQVTVTASTAPPVAVTACAKPTTFTYSAALTTTAPGSVSYRWVYSSGTVGRVQTLRFAAAGTQQVPGGSVQAKAAGSGWAEVEMVSPAGSASNRATYRLMCAEPGVVTATAAARPAAASVTCGTPPPAVTFTGSIHSTKAGTVTYYWAQSDGTNTPAAHLVFRVPGTLAAGPLTIIPPSDTASGGATLVVTSPAAAASKLVVPSPQAVRSNAASFSLSCTPVIVSISSPTSWPGATLEATCGGSSQGGWGDGGRGNGQGGSGNSQGDSGNGQGGGSGDGQGGPGNGQGGSGNGQGGWGNGQGGWGNGQGGHGSSVDGQGQGQGGSATFTVSAVITSSLAGTVSFEWQRSDGTTRGGGVAASPAGARVTDTVTVSASSSPFTDTLQVTSPGGAGGSQSIVLSVSCNRQG